MTYCLPGQRRSFTCQVRSTTLERRVYVELVEAGNVNLDSGEGAVSQSIQIFGSFRINFF